jgi:hypothetical protein
MHPLGVDALMVLGAYTDELGHSKTPIGLLGWHGHYFLGMNNSKGKSFFYRNNGQCVEGFLLKSTPKTTISFPLIRS